MSRRRTPKVPKEKIECKILSLSHEGRGIAKFKGKTQFVEGALPGETVEARYLFQKSKYDELLTTNVLESSEDRMQPPCRHSERCGGCSLQYMRPDAQIQFKQGVLAEQFRHFGDLVPDEWVAPLLGESLGYRTKARMGVRYLPKADKVIIGFREKRSRHIAAIDSCDVLEPRIGRHLESLGGMLASLSDPNVIAHIEAALGDASQALVFRLVKGMSPPDQRLLVDWSKQRGFDVYLQTKGATVPSKIWPENEPERLYYELPLEPSAHLEGRSKAVTLAFHPADFTQVNSVINRQMVNRALEWLAPESSDRVLDLFCGLGNFTVPLATCAGSVVGVEADASMVARGEENAERNGLENVRFYAADLYADFTRQDWAREGFDKILIDPPRAGALEVVKHLANFKAKRVVYVSCNPSTLARDAGVLVENGYRMLKAGVMDMFPHTTHVESIALFEFGS